MRKVAKISIIVGLAAYLIGLCLGIISLISSDAFSDVKMNYFSLTVNVLIIVCAIVCLTFLIQEKSVKILGGVLVVLNALSVAVDIIDVFLIKMPQYLAVSLIGKWEIYITAILQGVNLSTCFSIISVVGFITGGVFSILAKK